MLSQRLTHIPGETLFHLVLHEKSNKFPDKKKYAISCKLTLIARFEYLDLVRNINNRSEP